MTRRVVVVGISVVLLLTACGTTTSTTAQRDDGVPTVDCGGAKYDLTTFADAPPASSLPDGPTGAVDDAGASAFDPSQEWKVVHQSDSRVDLVRELDTPFDNGGGDVRTHESRVLERITGASNVPEGTWMLTSAGPCTQRLASNGALGEADLTLAAVPSLGDTSVDLFVHERACASGESAEGRIELIELNEAAEEIQLRIGVRPRSGDQDCQGNPPTPFTVELTEPLGEREIVDVSVVPPRPVTVDSHQ